MWQSVSGQANLLPFISIQKSCKIWIKEIVLRNWKVTIINKNPSCSQYIIFSKVWDLAIYFKSIVNKHENQKFSQPECWLPNQSLPVILTLWDHLQDYKKRGALHLPQRDRERLKWNNISEGSTWTWGSDRPQLENHDVTSLGLCIFTWMRMAISAFEMSLNFKDKVCQSVWNKVNTQYPKIIIRRWQ